MVNGTLFWLRNECITLVAGRFLMVNANLKFVLYSNNISVDYIFLFNYFNSSVPEGKLMGVELIGVYKSGSINWG